MNASPTDDAELPLAKAHSFWRPRRKRVIVLLAIALGIWGWFDVRVRGTVDPRNPSIHKTDFTVFTEAGAAFFDGRPPYEVSNPRGWRYLYPPLFAMVVAPLHALPAQAQVLVWFTASVLMGWGCYRECIRIAQAVLPTARQLGTFGPIPSWIGYVSATAALLPALNCLQRGQVGIAKLYLLLLGFRLLVSSRGALGAFLAGAVLALPIVLKITPLLPVAFILAQQLFAALCSAERGAAMRRAASLWLGTTAGLAAALLLIPALLIGWSANARHLETWWNMVSTQADNASSDDFAGDSYSVRNQSLMNAAHRFENWANYVFADGPSDHQMPAGAEDDPLPDTPGEWLVLAARLFAACLLAAVCMSRPRDAVAHAAGFGMACVGTLVLAPIARAHYFVLLLPGTIFLGVWLVRAARPRLAVALVVAPAALTIAHYALLDFAGRVGLLGLGITLWYLAGNLALLFCGQHEATAGATVLPPHPQRDAPRPADPATVDKQARAA